MKIIYTDLVDLDFYETWKQLGFMRYDVAEGRERVFDRIVEDLKMMFNLEY